MALIQCPECGREMSDEAVMCPGCGRAGPRGRGYVYKSRARLFGLPLVHVILGRGQNYPGKVPLARGIIAVGPLAAGVVAVGGVAVGLVTFGGVALGGLALGGLAVGLGFAGGGLAIGGVAVGGCAIGYYALGGGAFGPHALGANSQDQGAIDFFRRVFGDAVDVFTRKGNR
jgi:hypothetical protein